MSSPMRMRRMAWIGLGVATAVILSGCGIRVDHERVVAVGNGYAPASLAAAEAAAPAVGSQDAAASTVADPQQAAASTGVTKPTQGQVAAPAAGKARDKAGAVAAPAAKGAAKSASGASSAASGAAAALPAACPAGLAPIKLGQTLAVSGLVGGAIAGLRNGVAVWAADVNSRGGVQCHPVQITTLDDASDSSRVASNWNQLMKVKGAIACLGCGTPITIAALRSAAERDRIPVVGGDLTAEDWYTSAWLFPQGGAPLASYSGAYVEAAKVAGGGKSGLLYCVEASICTGLKNNHPDGSKRAGLELGPVKAVSLTQSDFTAECQQMKDAGVKVLFFGLDGSASTRAARSCISIGYKPTIATAAIAVSSQAAADQNLRTLGTFLGSGIAPYLTSNLPVIDAFQTAMKRYAPSQEMEQQAMLGWASGKLFEAALAKVADKARAGNVTTEMVAEGLWQLKNEKLGGLSPGVSFNKGAPAKYLDCYYSLKLGKDGFSSPTGAKPVCTKRTSPSVTNNVAPDVAPQQFLAVAAGRSSAQRWGRLGG